jgi:hypothetical protein
MRVQMLLGAVGMNHLASTSLLLTLLSACATESDIWWPQEDPGGKADSFATIKGSDIPSQHVDPSKSYMLTRGIETLRKVGAFDMVQDRLVQRIDGIIANMPADRKLHLAELVRMESPAIQDSLFPDEVAALPSYWKMMEAPATNDFVTGPDATFGVVDAATPPGPAVVPAKLAITSLAAELQTAASRLQNKYNADGDASTVQYEDLSNAIANPAPFTPEEISAFQRTQVVFREQAVATAAAELVVSPTPGPYAKAITVGPLKLDVAGDTRIDEARTHSGSQLKTTLVATQTQVTTATLPTDTMLLMISKDSLAETAYATGVVQVGSGQHVFELWKNGQRTFHTNVHTPALTRRQTLDLGNHLDYTLVAGLTPLVRNVVSGTAVSGWVTKFDFTKTAVAPTDPVPQQALNMTATPHVKIPVGRYRIPNVNMMLHVYPNNVLWLVSVNQTGHRMLPQTVTNNAAPARFVNTPLGAAFDVATSTLRINNYPSVVLNASMRDI